MCRQVSELEHNLQRVMTEKDFIRDENKKEMQAVQQKLVDKR